MIGPIDTACLQGKQIHFLGIGGSGMSGLARLTKAQGANVSGADMRQSKAVKALQETGIPVQVDSANVRIPDGVELLVISAAISYNHLQVIEAKNKGVKVIKYAQLLGKLMADKKSVAVAGTHGKSTTTSILSHILIEADLEPSFIVGANCTQIGGGSRCGKSDILVAEACEFDRSFHNLHPTSAVILNVEADHLDIYSSIEEIIESFAQFAQQLPPVKDGGFLLINHEMEARLAISVALACKVETIGFASEADWQVEIKSKPEAQVCLFHNGGIKAKWKNPLPGDHMAYNSAAAAILAHNLGAKWGDIAGAIENFKGLDRRMQWLGDFNSATVIDDYAHHPTEIDATLRALKNHYKPSKLICIFQPHQHSRTRFLMQQFAVSFSQADLVIVPDIYFVRDSENDRQKITSQDLVKAIKEQGADALYIESFSKIAKKVGDITEQGDLVVTMGAGDIWKVAMQLVQSA